MKLKTHKLVSKRFWFTKSGKAMKRKAGQDHFNSRESGNTTRTKRIDTATTVTNAKTLRKAIPYNS
ncbi:MAG: 50S ribosomal protein L35 [Patescibacteria group bacterium]